MLTSVPDGREFQRARARSLVDRCCTVVDDSFAMMQSQVIAEGKLGKLPTSPKSFRSEEKNVGERHVPESVTSRPLAGLSQASCTATALAAVLAQYVLYSKVLYFAADCNSDESEVIS